MTMEKNRQINVALGQTLYHDWKAVQYETHEQIRQLGKEQIDLNALKEGFIKERAKYTMESYEGEHEECFWGAADEIGIHYLPKS